MSKWKPGDRVTVLAPNSDRPFSLNAEGKGGTVQYVLERQHYPVMVKLDNNLLTFFDDEELGEEGG